MYFHTIGAKFNQNMGHFIHSDSIMHEIAEWTSIDECIAVQCINEPISMYVSL